MADGKRRGNTGSAGWSARVRELMSRKVLLCLLAAGFLVLVGGCVLQEKGLLPGTGPVAPEVCKKQLFAMDTYMEFTAYGENCQQAVDTAMEEVKRLDALLSPGSPSSEVSRLNEAGTLEVSEDVAELLEAGMTLYEKTGGLFDFTIYPVMKLWGFPTKEFRVPGEQELADALKLVDASRVKILRGERTVPGDPAASGEPAAAEGTAALGEPAAAEGTAASGEPAAAAQVILGAGQQVDFGGIAKGYTSARLMEIFRSYGINSGLVSLGGNIQALNAKPDGSKWNIGIRDPQGSQEDYIAVASVENCAVVTSGGYERYFEENGKRYIHIIDPRTGYPAESGLASVTIFSGDGTLADALSTSLYIMGLEEAVSFWRKNGSDFEMALLTDSGEFYVSEGISGDFRTDGKVHVVRKQG